jgi:Porin subfamily
MRQDAHTRQFPLERETDGFAAKTFGDRRKLQMGFAKFFTAVLLGSAAALTGVAGVSGAKAADLPARAAAPIEYVRICDAYGAGFFYIPGTETCLRVGGLVLAEGRTFDPSYSIGGTGFYGNGIPAFHTALAPVGVGAGVGFLPGITQYSNNRSRDAASFNALGRVELDARTASPWGTLRAFARVDAYYGSGANSATGSLAALSNTWNTTAGTSSQRETTIINKAFIQFAGLTAGRAQSMFDFYADAYNWVNVRGSNATVALFSYTATFGSGFSSTISFEDQPSRRAAIGSTIASATATAAGAPIPINVGGVTGTSFQGQPAGARVPDIVGNLRLDQPWGAVQLSASAHQVRASLFGSTALGTPPATGAGLTPAYAFPALVSNSYGFAVQGGIQLNADYLSPGDKLWLQAAYEKGAFGYIAGNNLGYNYGAVNQNRYAGSGFTASDYSTGWNSQPNSDCVFTGSGSCEQQWGWDITGAYKHYWIPTLSSGIYGSYMEVHYSANALSGFGGGVGISNIKEGRVGTNLIWTPLKGFDIGGEFMYVHVNQSRPAGLVPDATLVAVGLPAFRPNQSQYEGRIRVQRAF